MSIKVRHVPAYTIESRDVEAMYQALLCYIDSMEKFKSWCDDTGPKDGRESAVKNMNEEIVEWRALALDIYDKCFANFVEKPTEREPRRKDQP